MPTPKGGKAWNSGTSKGWVDPRGYRQTRVNGKTVREHRVIMEKHLGRKLEAWEHVHHRDGDKLNNSIENLEVIDGAQHTIEHHKGSKRPDQTKITLSTIKTMQEEIKRLKSINSEMLEALDAAPAIRIDETLEQFKDRYSAWYRNKVIVLAKARGES